MKIPLAKIGIKHRALTIPKDRMDHILRQEADICLNKRVAASK